jgi:hypothetical protein
LLLLLLQVEAEAVESLRMMQDVAANSNQPLVPNPDNTLLLLLPQVEAEAVESLRKMQDKAATSGQPLVTNTPPLLKPLSLP